MRLYNLKSVEDIINKYNARDGNIKTIEEGCLGYGFMVLYGEGLKTVIIKEIYINEWSSGHSIISYTKVPKKYLKYIN